MQELKAGVIGCGFFAQVSFRTGYNVYPNQPYLATEERMVLYDMGVHLFDLVRFFMGEVVSLSAQTHRINPNVLAKMLPSHYCDIRTARALRICTMSQP